MSNVFLRFIKLDFSNEKKSTLFRMAAAATLSLGLIACGETPPRLSQDVNLEDSKILVENRVIAPLLNDDDNAATTLPEHTPRRQLLQLRYHPSSFNDPNFVSTLEKLAAIYQTQKQSANTPDITSAILLLDDGDNNTATEAIPNEAEIKLIETERHKQRMDFIIHEGLKLEQELFAKLRQIDDNFTIAGQALEATLFSQFDDLAGQIKALEDNSIPGVGTPPPTQIFGHDLTRDNEGYLALPHDLALLSNNKDGTISSKIGTLHNKIENRAAQFSFTDLQLANALRFISGAADLDIVVSTAIENNNDLVTLDVEANTLSVLDAVLNQYDISILYHPELEVAQFYTDSEFAAKLTQIRQAVSNYNSRLHNQRELEKLKKKQRVFNMLIDASHDVFYEKANINLDKIIAELPKNQNDLNGLLAATDMLQKQHIARQRLLAMVEAAQSLLEGESKKFFRYVDKIDRAPGNAIVAETLHSLTIKRLSLGQAIDNFDAETETLVARSMNRNDTQTITPALYNAGGTDEILASAVEDACIIATREIFTEKVAVYGGDIAINRIGEILEGYFGANGQTAPAQSDPNDAAASIVPLNNRPASCGDDPSRESPYFIAASDDSGFVVTGLASDIEIFVKLVEEFDRPQRQVLVEVFMINVVKDFSRRLDLSFQTDATATNVDETDGFFLRRDLTVLSQNITSQESGGFVSGLISPNNKIQALADFIERNDLGRTISSPTILVEEGGSAYVTRTNTKPVTRTIQQTILDANNNPITVPSSVTEDESVSFRLDVNNVSINPNNNNVSLEFVLQDQAFETALANVTADTGTTEDEIRTNFIAAPGDVIILAGLFKQIESAEVAGLPGTTTSGLPTAFLLGGEDNIGNTVEEMIILMAPTVIQPEVGKFSANSALDKKLGDRTQEGQ